MLNQLCGMRLCGRVYWIVSIRNILSAESEKTSLGNVLERVAFTEPAVLLENFAAFSRVVCAYAFVVMTGEFQWTVTLLPGVTRRTKKKSASAKRTIQVDDLVCRWFVATG
jgi:hypothetical protein